MSEDAAARAFDQAARETQDQARIKLNFPKRGEAVAAGATSRFRGVSWLKARAKWHAQITINKKQVRVCACLAPPSSCAPAALRRLRRIN